MTCTHENSGCKDSRVQSGKGSLIRNFKYTRYRRMVCFDCGYSWRTFEMTEQQMIDAARNVLESHFKATAEKISDFVKMELSK